MLAVRGGVLSDSTLLGSRSRDRLCRFFSVTKPTGAGSTRPFKIVSVLALLADRSAEYVTQHRFFGTVLEPAEY